MNTRHKVCYFFVSLLLLLPTAQVICQNNFILRSQADVDNFGSIAPDSIPGNLIISSTGIQQLNALSSISYIKGYLYIHDNGRIKNLHGLDSLRSISGALILRDNERLTNLRGLGKLENIGTYVTIERNESLQNLQGLGPLKQINRDFAVLQNHALIDFKGKEGITSINGSIDLCDNPLLKDFAGLNLLERVGGSLYIYNSPAMQDMTGLNNLVSIGSEFDISNNENLVSLQGMESLVSIGDCVYIYKNPSLASIEELRNLRKIGGTMMIIFNKRLAQCEISGLCSYFLHRSGGINIWENGQTCSDKKAIQLPCRQSDPVRNIVADPIRVFPTRTKNALFIEGLAGSTHRIQIFNISGQLISDRRSDQDQPLHLVQYPNGTYFIAIESKQTRSIHQVIKW